MPAAYASGDGGRGRCRRPRQYRRDQSVISSCQSEVEDRGPPRTGSKWVVTGFGGSLGERCGRTRLQNRPKGIPDISDERRQNERRFTEGNAKGNHLVDRIKPEAAVPSR